MLAHLSHQAKNPTYRFKRLYRNLYNPLFFEMFLTTSDDNLRQQIPTFIAKLKTENYLPKEEDCRHRLDHVVSQIVEAILIAIYIENGRQILSPLRFPASFYNSTWLFSGRIESRSTKPSLHFLKAKIADRKFLNLIQKLDALGYLRTLLLQIACGEFDRKINGEFPDLAYIRVRHSLLIGVKGTKQEAKKMQESLVEIVEEKIGFRIQINGRSIYHRKERIPFCQYRLQFVSATKTPIFFIEEATIIRRLKRNRIVRVRDNGELIAIHRPFLLNLSERDIITMYKREFQQLANDYYYATNRSLLKKCHRYMRESMLKTLAYKYKTTVKKVAKSLHNRQKDKGWEE